MKSPQEVTSEEVIKNWSEVAARARGGANVLVPSEGVLVSSLREYDEVRRLARELLGTDLEEDGGRNANEDDELIMGQAMRAQHESRSRTEG